MRNDYLPFEWICSVWRDRLELSWREERQQVKTPESSSARAAQYWVHSFFAAMFTGLVLLEVIQDKQKSSF